MANPRPLTGRKRRRFLAALDEDERRLFERLEQLLQQRTGGLEWHWQVGRCVNDLHGGGGRFADGRAVIERLAGALGCSEWLLYKPLAFARHYRSRAELAELEKLKLPWAVVAASFPLEEADRRRTLQKAARRGWSVEQMRMEVRRRLGAPEHVSGRRPRRPDRRAPEAELHGLMLKAQEWERYVELAWLGEEEEKEEEEEEEGRKKTPPMLPHLESLAARGVSEKLRGLLADAARSLRNTVRLATRLRGALLRLAEAPRRPKP
jgi:hypothetical protein